MKVRTVRTIVPPTPIRPVADVDDQFDELVERACDGDRRALGAIAIALTGELLAAAKDAMGDFGFDAADVVQELFLAIMEGRARFRRGKERASEWLMRIVREMARQDLRARERDWEIQ